MEFNITQLDKILLLQSLYIHADPKGYGEYQYQELLKKGKTVEGLASDECIAILKGGHKDVGYLADYYNGKPLKLDWKTTPGGQILANSMAYDIAHGKFRFLEALLNVFDMDEIVITRKEYLRLNPFLDFRPEDARTTEYELELFVEHAIPVTEETGTSWRLDSAIRYRSAFLSGLDL